MLEAAQQPPQQQRAQPNQSPPNGIHFGVGVRQPLDRTAPTAYTLWDMTKRPTSVHSTRLVDDGKLALAELADELDITPTMLSRAILTAGLRTLYDIADEVADENLAKIRAYKRKQSPG